MDELQLFKFCDRFNSSTSLLTRQEDNLSPISSRIQQDTLVKIGGVFLHPQQLTRIRQILIRGRTTIPKGHHYRHVGKASL
jgi:hypothetical protein